MIATGGILYREKLNVLPAAVFAEYMQYVRTMDFYQKPDYTFWYKKFFDVMVARKYVLDWWFDWCDQEEVGHRF